MKRVEYFFAMLPSETRPGKFVKSRWRMPREEIERRGGTVLEDTREERELPETDEEKVALFKPRGDWGRFPGS